MFLVLPFPFIFHMLGSDAKAKADGLEALVLGPHTGQDSMKVLFNMTGRSGQQVHRCSPCPEGVFCFLYNLPEENERPQKPSL